MRLKYDRKSSFFIMYRQLMTKLEMIHIFQAQVRHCIRAHPKLQHQKREEN